MQVPPVQRSTAHRPAAPVRIAHLGLGNFFRAHQAWYTSRATDADQWGIAAFTGRRPDLANSLRPQGGLFTLVTRSAEGDQFELVDSLSAVYPASDHDAWLSVMRSAELSIVTLTVTEAGYLQTAHGELDQSNEHLAKDIAALRDDVTAPVSTAPARLVAGLVARERAGGGPIAVVPCDNMPGNGEVVGRALRQTAELVDPDIVRTIDRMASFVTTMVDRITPATTSADREVVRAATGMDDATPVVTEPFSEWVVSGSFPAGRPAWETSGVTIVDDVEPFERRKLWLLNGGHSLLAYGASVRGHETVADAVADPQCCGWLEQWWDDASAFLPLARRDLDDYRGALLARFSNPRMRHRLAQIAADGSVKLPVRILPALTAARDTGKLPLGATRALAAWICHLRGHGAPVNDPDADRAIAAARGAVAEAVPRVVSLLGGDVADDQAVVDAVTSQVHELTQDE